jgi:hypothetical protein
MSKFPISSVCPQCGSKACTSRKPKELVVFAEDRVCKVCLTKYSLPIPAWGFPPADPGPQGLKKTSAALSGAGSMQCKTDRSGGDEAGASRALALCDRVFPRPDSVRRGHSGPGAGWRLRRLPQRSQPQTGAGQRDRCGPLRGMWLGSAALHCSVSESGMRNEAWTEWTTTFFLPARRNGHRSSLKKEEGAQRRLRPERRIQR